MHGLKDAKQILNDMIYWYYIDTLIDWYTMKSKTFNTKVPAYSFW